MLAVNLANFEVLLLPLKEQSEQIIELSTILPEGLILDVARYVCQKKFGSKIYRCFSMKSLNFYHQI
jgi:hypothetical protein